MDEGQEFIDYYDVLQVNPGCDGKILKFAYHHFAKLYHPDHSDTADIDKFDAISEAYRVLNDPEQRAQYDKLYLSHKGEEPSPFPEEPEFAINEKTALNDAEIHETILLHLYKQRRENPSDPGAIAWLMQEMLDCREEEFEFHVWYLESKGYLQKTEQGTLAVTIDGVDHVIANSRTISEKKLFLTKARDVEADFAGDD